MSSEVAIREEAPPIGLSLMEGPDPATAVVYARRVSAAIAGVLEEDNGIKTIQGKKHITIEGWQTIAAMTGHTVEVEWSRVIPDMRDDKGTDTWEARSIVRDQGGRVVAAGESMADPREPGANRMWARSGNYSVRSMAQTRSMSRALSSRMRYIVQLAGFSGTPAEEIQHDTDGAGGGLPTEPVWQERQRDAEARLAALDSEAVPAEFFAGLGVDHPSKLKFANTWVKVDAELSKREADALPVVEGEVIEDKGEALFGKPGEEPVTEPKSGQAVLAEQKAKARSRAPGDA